jgi:hypothetical protein
MGFTDPQSITIDATPYSHARTGQGLDTGTFRTADGTKKLTISHQYKSRTRRTIRLDLTKIAADPFDSSVNAEYSMSTYVVIDHPRVGFTSVELKEIVLGLAAYLTADSGAKTAQLLGGES